MSKKTAGNAGSSAGNAGSSAVNAVLQYAQRLPFGTKESGEIRKILGQVGLWGDKNKKYKKTVNALAATDATEMMWKSIVQLASSSHDVERAPSEIAKLETALARGANANYALGTQKLRNLHKHWKLNSGNFTLSTSNIYSSEAEVYSRARYSEHMKLHWVTLYNKAAWSPLLYIAAMLPTLTTYEYICTAMRRLLRAGGNPNARLYYITWTPLHIITSRRVWDSEHRRVIIDTLLAHGALPSAKDYAGRNPLDISYTRRRFNPQEDETLHETEGASSSLFCKDANSDLSTLKKNQEISVWFYNGIRSRDYVAHVRTRIRTGTTTVKDLMHTMQTKDDAVSELLVPGFYAEELVCASSHIPLRKRLLSLDDALGRNEFIEVRCRIPGTNYNSRFYTMPTTKKIHRV
jgi:hypothetical protein